MSKHPVFPNMPGRDRPEVLSDRLGYEREFGDKEWKSLKKVYVQVPGGWRRRCDCCDG